VSRPHTNSQGNPAPLVTDFQQDTANIAIEAAAHTFLNWVYRVNTSVGATSIDPCTLLPTPSPSQWTGPGFLNQEWSATPYPSFIANSAGIPGTLDTSLPGDKRHFDIDARMRQIFSSNGW